MKKNIVIICMVLVALLVGCVFISLCIGDIEDPPKKKYTEYEFSINFDCENENSKYILNTPFLVPRFDEISTLYNSFLDNIEISNDDVHIVIETIDEQVMLNITGKGSFNLTSKFQEIFSGDEWYILSTRSCKKNDYEGNYDFYYSTDSQNEDNSSIKLEYNFGEKSYGMSGVVDGIISNSGWQEVRGIEEYRVSSL